MRSSGSRGSKGISAERDVLPRLIGARSGTLRFRLIDRRCATIETKRMLGLGSLSHSLSTHLISYRWESGIGIPSYGEAGHWKEFLSGEGTSPLRLGAWNRQGSLSGLAIALIIHSLDPSLFARLILSSRLIGFVATWRRSLSHSLSRSLSPSLFTRLISYRWESGIGIPSYGEAGHWKEFLLGFNIGFAIHSLEGFSIALAIHSLEGFSIAFAIRSLDPTLQFCIV